MKKTSSLFALCLLPAGFLLTGCGTSTVAERPTPVVVTYELNPTGENLPNLVNIYETEDNCGTPFGGDRGRNLFFTLTDRNRLSSIVRIENIGDRSINPLTDQTSQNEAPSYCASTNMVAFHGRQSTSSSYDIYMTDARQGGAKRTVITDSPNYDETYPDLSRDGRRIVYEKKPRYGKVQETGIYIKDLRTNLESRVTNGINPVFSPDGRNVAFVQYSADGNSTSLCTINLDGNNISQLTDPNTGAVFHPRFSPDGKHIVFQYIKKQKNDFDLYVIDLSGNNLTQLTSNPSYDGQPYWAANNVIYFTSDRGGRKGHNQIFSFRYNAGGSTTTYTYSTQSSSSGNDSYDRSSSYSDAYHTVRDGETITQIARQYGITPRDVVKWNNLSTMTLTPGMKLKVTGQ